MSKRRVYSNQFKREILEGFYSGKLNSAYLKKEYDLITADLTRFEKQLTSAGIKLPPKPAKLDHAYNAAYTAPIANNPTPGISLAMNNDKDTFINTLLAELGKAHLKIQQLEAQLGGNKRYSDNPVFQSGGA